MGKINIIILLVLFLSISTVGYSEPISSWKIGIEVGFAGGPIFSVLGSVGLSDWVNLELTVGGFPGILLRSKLDVRYSLLKSNFSPYLQGGVGYVHMFNSNRQDYNHLKELHLKGGGAYSISKTFIVKGNLGLLWAPHVINPQEEREFPDRLPIVPLVNVGLLFGPST